ncbi:carbohydrate ABC transporter substrate-binding protein (CUT1 family) [Yoonia maricola]|uniref:Carbohydrate ABC transporter substrate-binding protein (CUT1 family) n=1 Tax=Yoonia maricola TaxID=420999 RepID=A0A2M8W119_9RHOB|nr:sugar ABC transporter substrate-binding protein [Yoonia maricola]PJI84634.1 carbohydrate ABC transporter substrate-binding protein (CUT1 family) [Yoonia maricola]
MKPSMLKNATLGAGLAMSVALPTVAVADEINVVLFAMPYTQGLAKLEADFEAATGHTANIEVIGQDVFENRITLSFTGQTGDVDVVHTPVIQVQRWIEAGWLRPITAEVDGMATKDDILAGPLDAYLVNGDRWALPFFAETGMMAYRTDLLAAAGYDAPPATWDEMLEVAAAVKTDQVGALAMRVAPGQGFNMFVFPMIMRAYGGAFFTDYSGGDLTPNMNTPEALAGLEVYSQLMNDYGPEGIGNFNFGEVAASIQSGQVAMIVDGTSIAARALDPEQSQFADQISIAAVPSGPAGRSPAIAVHGLGIPADAPNPEASFAFIEWATSAETLTKIALSEPYPDFIRASVAENPEVVAKYEGIHPDFLNLKVEMLGDAIGHYRPLLPQWPEIGQIVGENINAAVNEIMSNEDALAQSDADIADIMSE